MSVQVSDPALAEIRQIQAQTLLQLAEMKGQHPAEIDSALAEEILAGSVVVDGFEPAITVNPTTSQAFPWEIALASAALGAGVMVIATWVL